MLRKTLYNLLTSTVLQPLILYGVNDSYAQLHFLPPNVTSIGGHGYDPETFDIVHPWFSTIYTFFTGQNYAMTHINMTGTFKPMINLFLDMNVEEIGESIIASGWTPDRPILYASCYAGWGGSENLSQSVNNYLAQRTKSRVYGQGAFGPFTVDPHYRPHTYDVPYYTMDVMTHLQSFVGQ